MAGTPASQLTEFSESKTVLRWSSGCFFRPDT